MADESQISTFYSNKEILITGGTGFMGKVLIWKLLQSCPQLQFIYVLMRPKHGKNPMSRKREIFDAPIFDNFKKNNPKIFDKVIFVSGDVGEEGIGLSDRDRDMLIDGVSIVFHSAAVLKMDANLRTAVNVNTVGTVRMLDLAMKMKKLEAFVHISTAFCCCENLTVEEKIYPSKHNPYDIINLIQWMEPELLEKITPKLIHPLPNTYIYSKRLTESLLTKYETKVPIIVARPSIVIPSYKEPLPGWNDSLNGPAGILVAGGKGVMRTTMMHIDVKSDVIPVDFAINSIITLPWANSKQQLLEEISVYNISQTAYKDMTWRQMMSYFRKALEKYPFEKILWYSNFEKSVTTSTLVYKTKTIFVHYLPAYIIDFILLLVGQKPFLVRVQNKLKNGEKVLKYFTQQQWVFLHDRILQVEKLLNDADKSLFTINMADADSNIQKYVDNAICAMKVFIFKEDINNLNTARRINNIMYVVDKIALALRYFVLWKVFIYIFNIVLDTFDVYGKGTTKLHCMNLIDQPSNPL